MRTSKLKRERDAWQKLACAALYAIVNNKNPAEFANAKIAIDEAITELEKLDCKLFKRREHDSSKTD